MKEKTLYCLSVRFSDTESWSPPDLYARKRDRDNAASHCRILLGMRTYSYEKKVPLPELEGMDIL